MKYYERDMWNMEELALQEIKRDIEEIKIQLAFLLSRYMEEGVSEDERLEIEEILKEVEKGEYITKEALKLRIGDR